MLTSSGVSLRSKNLKLQCAANEHELLALRFEGVCHAYLYCAVECISIWLDKLLTSAILGRCRLSGARMCQELILVFSQTISVL